MLNDGNSDFELEIRQQPQHAKLAIGTKEKDRKPVDPPPIIQLKVSTRSDPAQSYLQSPYLFMTCRLISESGKDEAPPANSMIGTVVSSLHKLKDNNNNDGGFFIFGDLSVKTEVFPVKSFPGLQESTFLTRSFSDQGVRIRLRKDSRPMSTKKRNATAAELSRRADSYPQYGNTRRDLERSASGDSLGHGRQYASPTGLYDRSAGTDNLGQPRQYASPTASVFDNQRTGGNDNLGAGRPYPSPQSMYDQSHQSPYVYEEHVNGNKRQRIDPPPYMTDQLYNTPRSFTSMPAAQTSSAYSMPAMSVHSVQPMLTPLQTMGHSVAPIQSPIHHGATVHSPLHHGPPVHSPIHGMPTHYGPGT